MGSGVFKLILIFFFSIGSFVWPRIGRATTNSALSSANPEIQANKQSHKGTAKPKRSSSFGTQSGSLRSALKNGRAKKSPAPRLQKKVTIVRTPVIPLSFYQSLGKDSYEIFRLLYFQVNREWTTQTIEDVTLKWMNQILKDKNLNSNLEAYQFTSLLKSINEAMALFEKDRNYMTKIKLRAKYEDLFSGLIRAVQIASHYNVGLNQESYLKLTDQIYTQSFEIFDLSSENYTFRDLFWDFQFLRALQFPTDLTRIHTERLLLQENFFVERAPAEFKTKNKHSEDDVRSRPFNTYQGWVAALSAIAIEKNHFIRFERPDQTEVLYRQAYSYFSENQDLQSLKKVQKAYLKAQGREGSQEKVYKIKCELARQQIWIAFDDWKHNFSISRSFQLVTLTIGYIFVALPLELILLFIAVLILSYQGRISLTSEEHKKLGLFRLAWIMFTSSYTGVNSNFYSKLASSLLLFGIGLYFNSAKTMLESLITNP